MRGKYADNTACTPCPAGKYAAENGTEKCTAAPLSTYVDEEGATDYTDCPRLVSASHLLALSRPVLYKRYCLGMRRANTRCPRVPTPAKDASTAKLVITSTRAPSSAPAARMDITALETTRSRATPVRLGSTPRIKDPRPVRPARRATIRHQKANSPVVRALLSLTYPLSCVTSMKWNPRSAELCARPCLWL